MVRENKSYTLTCKCSAEITVTKIDEAKKQHWIVESQFDPRRDRTDFTKVVCPECVELERMRKYNSDNIWDRINAGYYKDHPEQFNDHAIEFVGLKGHPKAEKAMSQAYEDGHHAGHSEVLNVLLRYAEVLL